MPAAEPNITSENQNVPVNSVEYQNYNVTCKEKGKDDFAGEFWTYVEKIIGQYIGYRNRQEVNHFDRPAVNDQECSEDKGKDPEVQAEEFSNVYFQYLVSTYHFPAGKYYYQEQIPIEEQII